MRSIASHVAVALLLCMFVPAEANAQDDRSCHRIAGYAASFLERCGDRLRSFTLSLEDIRRTAGSDLHGRFYFQCPIEPLCIGEPEISGFFIDAKGWARSARDQQAIVDVLRHALMKDATWGQPGARGSDLLESRCKAFDVQVAGLAGQALCFVAPDLKSSALVVVSADADVGFVLVFQRRDLDWEDLRTQALRTMPRFSIERASGDAALLRWMK